MGGCFDRQADDGFSSGLTEQQDYQTRLLQQRLWLLYHFTGQSRRLGNRVDTAGRGRLGGNQSLAGHCFHITMYGLILFVVNFDFCESSVGVIPLRKNPQKIFQMDKWWKSASLWSVCIKLSRECTVWYSRWCKYYSQYLIIQIVNKRCSFKVSTNCNLHWDTDKQVHHWGHVSHSFNIR